MFHKLITFSPVHAFQPSVLHFVRAAKSEGAIVRRIDQPLKGPAGQIPPSRRGRTFQTNPVRQWAHLATTSKQPEATEPTAPTGLGAGKNTDRL